MKIKLKAKPQPKAIETDTLKQRSRITEAVRNGVPIFNPAGSSIRRNDALYIHQTRTGNVHFFFHVEGAVESFFREEAHQEA